MSVRNAVRGLGMVLAMLMIASPAAAQMTKARFDAMAAEAKTVMQTEPMLALRRARDAKRQAHGILDDDDRALAEATGNWLQGEALTRVNDLRQAAPLVAQALRVTHRLASRTKLEGDVLLTSGSIYAAQGKVGKALSDYQQAYQNFQYARDARGRAIALLCIGSLYSDATDYFHALRYMDQAIDVYRGDPSMLISIYNNRASILQELGRLAEAEKQYKKALSLAGKMKSPLLQARILGNTARLQLKANNLPAALASVSKATKVVRDNKEATVWHRQIIAIAAQLAFQQRRYEIARSLIKERFSGVDLATTSSSVRDAHQTAYDTYHALHQPELALAHLSALRRLDEQATKLATSANTALLGARFDYANQELRIANLKADDARRSVALERERARTQRFVFASAVGATAIIIAALTFGLVTVRRSNKKVRAANIDLGIANAALGKALATKTEFLATTSHEIRTPLNGILGMTQVMLADRTLAPEMRDRLSIVHTAGETMRALVDDILDVAKIETGNLTIEHAPFDLRDTITGATQLWRDQARAKGVAFGLELDDCPGIIEGDAARVRQIVFNLLSNALKFTARGHVTLRVEIEASVYRIAVADSGIGIAADKLEEVFESFRQADTGITRQFGGTGLGLAICRNLAGAMGGEIAVESAAGTGSTFTVTLPLVPAAASPCPAPTAGDGRALLIVDRNPITRSMFRSLFAPHVATIMQANGVDEVLACLQGGAIAQVLLDEATIRAEGDYPQVLVSIVQTARRQGVRTVLLRIAGNPTEDLSDVGLDDVLTRPITGAALIQAMFTANLCEGRNGPLVSQAA